MEPKEQVKLQFDGVDVLNVNFMSLNRYVGDEEGKIELSIRPKVFYPKESPSHFNIIMEVSAKVEEVFALDVIGIGHFQLNQSVLESMKEGFINTNAPAIMFPYIRSFITTFTANLGNNIATIVIPPYVFTGKLEEIVDPEELGDYHNEF